MAAYRFPILVWEDYEGFFTAKLVEYEHNFYLIYGGKFFGGSDRAPTAVGDAASDALHQIKEYLTWSYEKYPWQPGPDFLEPRLIYFKVLIRPEYRVEDRVYPCDEPVSMRVVCVHGKQQSGLLVAVLPTLGVRFYYYEAKALKELVSHYVQERLKGMTPRELSRFLPPKSASLETIVLQVAQKETNLRREPVLNSLNSVAEPLGDKSLRKRFSRAWEREREVADLIQRINVEKTNVILVGENGAGKSSVLAEAVRQIERQMNQTEDEDEYALKIQHRFWLTSGARLIAGMRFLGQWQERCEQVIAELNVIAGTLCIENLLDLVRLGGASPNDGAAAFFMPYLQRGELRIIAEATPSELDACRRLLPGFTDLFQIMNIPTFGRDKAVSILERSAAMLKRNHNLESADGLPDMIYRLFNRFMPYQAFPGKTAAFLNELFERAALERASAATKQRAIELFIKRTGLPELFLRDEIPLAQSDVEEEFSRQVIGQDEACKTAAGLVTTFKAGLNDPNRPIAVLLFCGPTGVGKTELARAVSRFFFGGGEQTDRLIRLDMSEYSGYGAADRLISDGDGEPSELVKKARRQPFFVLLLDEIEKAGAAVFDVLLSMFDEGRLTDKFGRTTIFRSAVIIMTSNLGADKLEAIGFGKSSGPSYSAEAQSFFRPEFFNRIDSVVRFNSLDREMILAITRKELNEISQREGLTKSRLHLTWTERLVEKIAKDGFDPRYGARPLQRTLEMLLTAPLARYLIDRPELKDAEIEADLDESGLIAKLRPKKY